MPLRDLTDIYLGMMQFICIQMPVLIPIVLLPGLELLLPDYLSSIGAMPFFSYVRFMIP